jgi:hypothetical protein
MRAKGLGTTLKSLLMSQTERRFLALDHRPYCCFDFRYCYQCYIFLDQAEQLQPGYLVFHLLATKSSRTKCVSVFTMGEFSTLLGGWQLVLWALGEISGYIPALAGGQ